MNQLTLFFDHLLHLGTKNVDSEKITYIKQANLNGLIYFVLDLVLALVFYIVLDSTHISFGLLVSSITFLICSIGFNYLNWTTLSRLSTVSIGSFLVLYCAFYLGSESFTAASFLLGAIFPFVYFSIDEKKSIAFCIFIPLFCYAVLIAFNYNLGPQVGALTNSSILWLRLIFFMTPYVGIVVNTYTAVSEREKKTKTVKESQKLLETIFFALSHDLATPMQIISMTSQLGEINGSLPPDKIKKIFLNSQQMSRILKNLKTIAQTSTEGKISLNINSWPVIDLINDSVNFIQDQAASKKVIFQVDASKLVSNVNIFVDKDVFVFQIITNFLSNSLKFSKPDKKINITLSNTTDHVTIVIRDWGLGIEQSKINKLFSWSERTSTIGTNGEKGTGLGLPLAMKFLNAMNGQLALKSYHFSEFPEDIQGTEITITLPILKS